MCRACFVRIRCNLIAATCIVGWLFGLLLLLDLPLVCIRYLLISVEKLGAPGGKCDKSYW